MINPVHKAVKALDRFFEKRAKKHSDRIKRKMMQNLPQPDSTSLKGSQDAFKKACGQ